MRNLVLFRCKCSVVGPGQKGCTGPGERGKRCISEGNVGSLKVDGARTDGRLVWKCLSVSLLSVDNVQMTVPGTAIIFSVWRQVRGILLHVALHHFNFSWKLLILNYFSKTIFGWVATSGKRASRRPLHSRVIVFTSENKAIRRGPELNNICFSPIGFAAEWRLISPLH